jgi:hypothetical protein
VLCGGLRASWAVHAVVSAHSKERAQGIPLSHGLGRACMHVCAYTSTQ